MSIFLFLGGGICLYKSKPRRTNEAERADAKAPQDPPTKIAFSPSSGISMFELILERLKEAGLDLNDRECPVVNVICPYRKNFKCKYSRLERALMMLDCAFE